MLIPLLGFAPDVEQTTAGAMLECSDMVPSLKGMKAAPSNIVTSYAASSEAVTGSAILQKLDASVRFFIGGASKIQEGTAGSWADVSRGAGYSAGDNRWRFAQFGNDSLACNKSCVLQRSTATTFANITAPKADVMESMDGFIMLGNCDDSGSGIGTSYGDSPDRWWCSPYNDIAAVWTPAAATQCTTGRLVAAPGPIRAMRKLGANCVAYKDKAIFVATYVGPTAPVWRWDLIPGDIGCSSQEAVVNIGSAHLFIGETDIYRFDGSRPVSIGAPLRAWFFANLNRAYQYKIAALHDRVNSLVYWFYPTTTSSTGVLNAAIVYNYRTDRWGSVTRSIEMPIELVTGGITYDNLGSLYTNYDDLPNIAYDSPFWVANTPVPALISTDHRPYTVGGPASTWSFASHVHGDEQLVSLVNRVNVRWVVKPSTASLTPRYSGDEGDTITNGSAVTMSSGRFDFFREARWHQFYVSGSGDAELVGLDANIQPVAEE